MAAERLPTLPRESRAIAGLPNVDDGAVVARGQRLQRLERDGHDDAVRRGVVDQLLGVHLDGLDRMRAHAVGGGIEEIHNAAPHCWR